MRKLLALLFCFVGLSAMAQLPPMLRNFLTTNAVVPIGGSNVIYVANSGSDSGFQWGNPGLPAKTFTNALLQAQRTQLNGTAIISVAPGIYDCTNHTGITITNLNLTVIAWGATFNGWRTNNPQYLFNIGTNSTFAQFGGTYDFTSDFLKNGGRPFDIVDATNVYLFGVSVFAVVDNFFWTTRTPSTFRMDQCRFTSAWDMNQVTFTGPGTNSTFVANDCRWTKDARILGAVPFHVIAMPGTGILRLNRCALIADDLGNTNDVSLVSGRGRTNIWTDCIFRIKTTSIVAEHFANQGGPAANRPRMFLQNCSFSPQVTLTNTALLEIAGEELGAISLPTNSPPTSVTVGTTAPDYWFPVIDVTTARTNWVPAWINH